MSSNKSGDTQQADKLTHSLWETGRTVFYAVLIALAVRTTAYEPFNIPSGSMIPTLLVGDYLFVAKYSYGYSRFSIPLGLPLFSGRIFFNPPERGDVAVFRLPSDTSVDYIKRVVGLPGDRIQVRDGLLHINGEPVERERTDDVIESGPFGNTRHIVQYFETLPNGARYRIYDSNPHGSLDNTRVYTVPEGHYFMMGDNRDNSLDSRAGVGFVPAENLIGRAEIIFFSTDGNARWWEVWKWPGATRFGRFFHGVA